MLWRTHNTAGYGALYTSGAYTIRHFTEKDALGFGITCARLYCNGEQVAEFAGEGALERAQGACEERRAG